MEKDRVGEVIFVRHGQASFGTGDYDRLSELGWQQARWLGQHFAETGERFDTVITGTLRRHRETAEAMLEAMDPQPAPVETSELNELSYDHLHDDADAAGLLPQLDMRMQGSFRITMPIIMDAWENRGFATDHEPYSDFYERVVRAVEEATEPERRVLIVSSGGPKAILMRHVLGVDSAQMTRLLLQVMNSSYSRFGLYEDGLHLAEFNAVPHLSGRERSNARTYI
jgi:broad specificity phosphatase PhoE